MTNDSNWPLYVTRMAAGEQEALAALYDETHRLAYGLALRYLTDPAEAEEVVLDAYFHAWRSAAQFDPRRGSVLAWITMLVRSRSLDRLRSRAARRRMEEPGLPVREPVCPRSQPEEQRAAAGRGRVLREALAGLGTPQREVLALALLEGLTQSEIARRLTAPLGTVKTRMRQGLMRVREGLLERFGSEGAVRDQLSDSPTRFQKYVVAHRRPSGQSA